MNRPSRGARESATTTRYRGRLVVPVRLSRIDTATSSPPQCGKSRKILHAGKLPLHALELLHHLLELRVLLQEPVDVLDARAAAPRDPLEPADVDDLRVAPLVRSHSRVDCIGAVLVGGLV